MADERSKVADKPDILEKPDILRVPAPAPLVTFPVDVVVPEGRQQTPAVGQRASRADGRLHGLGQTKYIDDMYFPNMLFAKIKRAGVRRLPAVECVAAGRPRKWKAQDQATTGAAEPSTTVAKKTRPSRNAGPERATG